jgi:hypothetical protein
MVKRQSKKISKKADFGTFKKQRAPKPASFLPKKPKTDNFWQKSSTPSFLGAYLLAQWAVASPHRTTGLV